MVTDLGLNSKLVHEARLIRDAEKRAPATTNQELFSSRIIPLPISG
jgi:hypothetical protein